MIDKAASKPGTTETMKPPTDQETTETMNSEINRPHAEDTGAAEPFEKLSARPSSTEHAKTLVLYTSTQYMGELESRIRRYVIRDDEDVYSPRIARIKRFHGIDKRVESPLFPGYLFVNTRDPEGLYLRIWDAIGKVIFRYCRMIRNDEYICTLADNEAEDIEYLCGKSHIMENSVGYMKGDELIITSGPMKDLKGFIIKVDRHKKAAILEIPFLGEKRRVTVGLEIVKKLPADAEKV